MNHGTRYLILLFYLQRHIQNSMSKLYLIKINMDIFETIHCRQNVNKSRYTKLHTRSFNNNITDICSLYHIRIKSSALYRQSQKIIIIFDQIVVLSFNTIKTWQQSILFISYLYKLQHDNNVTCAYQISQGNQPNIYNISILVCA